MKQFFTKYLPVEGDIKEGDRFLCPDVRQEGEPPIYPRVPKCDKCYKVKLFLCTRDINVGDTFHYYHIDPMKSAEAKKPIWGDKLSNTTQVCLSIDERGNVCWRRESPYVEAGAVNYGIPKGATFKVIGEISPDALSYVKEGQEFDKDQIELWAVVDKKGEYPDFQCFILDTYKQMLISRPGLYPEEYRIKAKIKGPCGHFH